MLFLFGPSIPRTISEYFSAKARGDGHRVIFASMGTFAEQSSFTELRGISLEDLKDQPVVIFQSVASVGAYSADSMGMQLLLAAKTLHRNGAGPVWAVTPYAPYARQDQERPGKMDSMGCDDFASFMNAAHIVGDSSIEIHSDKAEQLLKNNLGEDNVFVLDPTELFAQDLLQLNLHQLVIMSPDKGANARADALADRLGADRFTVDKERDGIFVSETKTTNHHGDVKDRDVVLVDDMIDTGGTAMKAIELALKQGARRVFLYAAHPVLSNDALEKLYKMKKPGAPDQRAIERIRFLDTIARQADLETVVQQYGPEAEDVIGFISTAEMLYKHVTQKIATHTAMQPVPG